MTDHITVRGIRAVGYHGVLPEERRDGQPFVVDVEMTTSTRQAATADDLALTVDYGQIATLVVAVVEGPAVRLIETLAERIAAACLAHTKIRSVTVTVHKPEAPVGVPFDDVSVTIARP